MRRLPASACLLALAALSVACPAGRGQGPRSVLLVSLDTVRADALGCISGRGVTPELDALAARGAVMTDCTAPAPTTLPSHATLLTGHDPARHGIRSNGLFELPAQAETLAEQARAAGMRTGAFVASAVLAPHYGLAQGFETYDSPAGPGRSAGVYAERAAEEIRARCAAWVRGLPKEQPFFAWAHFFDAHAPYEAIEPFASRVPDDPYRAEIARVDAAVGALLADLAALGRLDETLVLVVADHGEDRGDHGEMTHGMFLYQSTQHVPFVAAGPGVAKGTRVTAPTGLVDVAPTVRDALGLPRPPGEDGRSLWDALRGRGDAPGERAFYMETWLPREEHAWSELRGWRRDAAKYVLAPRPELYDLAKDPAERDDLALKRPAEAERLQAELLAWLAQDRSQATATTLVPTQAEREMLESLGYAGGFADLPEGAALPDPKDGVAEMNRVREAGDLIGLGRLDEAEPALRAAIAANPAQPYARLMLVTLLLMQGREDEARAEAETTVEVAGRLPQGEKVAARAHVALAEIAQAQGRLPDALRHWDEALKAPQSDAARVHVAALNAQAGDLARAREILAPVLARTPVPPAAAELAAMLGPG